MSRNRINHAILLRKDRTRYFKNFKYPNIPLQEDDIYVITTIEDRLDSLAYQFYSDVRLWWVIANANPDLIKRDGYGLDPHIEVRIPQNIDEIIRNFEQLNK